MKLSSVFNLKSKKRKLVGAVLLALPLLGALGAAGVYATHKYLKGSAEEAWATQKGRGPDMHREYMEFDAFRHAYTSARLTQCFGKSAARFLMDMNEVLGQNHTAERRKDSFNNDASAEIWGDRNFRGLATVDAGLSADIMSAMQDGRVKTDPTSVPSSYQHRTYLGL